METNNNTIKLRYISEDSVTKFLGECGFSCTCLGVSIAPQLARYSLNLVDIRKLPKLKRSADIISAWAGAEAVFSKSDNCHIALEISLNERRMVNLNELACELRQKGNFSVGLGISTTGEIMTPCLDDLTHLLVAGTTGSGKSVALTDIILSLACYNSPKDLGFVLIDPKRTEFSRFAKLPHLLTPIITEIDKAEVALRALIDKMEVRYEKMAKMGLKNADGSFKKIVVVIDELADLVLQNDTIKELLTRLLQKSRACGFHFIVATQSPRASILSGLLLANLPSRLILTCANSRESILALSCAGAEKLEGKGDAFLKLPSDTKLIRVQVPFISEAELTRILP